jgi:hypothetical protein
MQRVELAAFVDLVLDEAAAVPQRAFEQESAGARTCTTRGTRRGNPEASTVRHGTASRRPYDRPAAGEKKLHPLAPETPAAAVSSPSQTMSVPRPSSRTNGSASAAQPIAVRRTSAASVVATSQISIGVTRTSRFAGRGFLPGLAGQYNRYAGGA